MAQDTALLRYLLKWARRSPWSWSQRDLAFEFDWTNDYISSNATIGRTGYDMNVAWNVSTGSDGDGSYFWINWNRDATAGTGTRAEFNSATTPTFTQATDITIKARVKLKSFAATDTAGIFWPRFVFCMSSASPNQIRFTVRWSSSVDVNVASSLNTLYDLYMVWVAADAKFYYYVNWVLQNVGWTAWPATWTTVWTSVVVWDNAIWSWNSSSGEKYIYHAAIRNKALTQAEIDADIALWNTAKNDPSIVAYYIPDNLQYNTQYMLDPKDLSSANRSKTWTSSVTANTTVAPDWTTTADTLAISWTATQGIRQTNSTISWSSLASKTFICKAFVKVTSWTSLFRLEMTHNNVAAYYSSNQTATTTRQEFTFTQTFTSSTSGSWITWWILNDTWWLSPTLEVRNVRVFLVNETLRDESPNIWWFIWWKTPLVMSARIKPDIDSTNTATKQCFFQVPRHYMQLRDTNNQFQFRSDTTLLARAPAIKNLWNGFRWKAHLLWVKYRDWTWRLYKAYVNWTLVAWAQSAYSNTIRPASTIYRTNASIWLYTTDYRDGNIRDIRAYTFTWSFTDTDALAIYNGGEPTSSGVTKYLHYKPPVGEVWTTTQDQSPNDRDWTLNNWVTRNYI